jgi:hypothetical protein
LLLMLPFPRTLQCLRWNCPTSLLVECAGP